VQCKKKVKKKKQKREEAKKVVNVRRIIQSSSDEDEKDEKKKNEQQVKKKSSNSTASSNIRKRRLSNSTTTSSNISIPEKIVKPEYATPNRKPSEPAARDESSVESGQIVGDSAEEEDGRAKKEYAVANRKPPQETRADETAVVLGESPEPEVREPGIRIKIDDLIEQTDKKKVVIFMRGLPGSGKSYFAELIKQRYEIKGFGEGKVFSWDGYFKGGFSSDENQTKKNLKAVHDRLQVTLQTSSKLMRHQASDKHRFIVVDAIHGKVEDFLKSYNECGKYRFEPYVAELKERLELCVNRQDKGWTLPQMSNLQENWQPTPSYMNVVDLSELLYL